MIFKKCLVCKKYFKVIPCRKDSAKYCSRGCYHQSKIGGHISQEHKALLSRLAKERHLMGKFPPPWNKGLNKSNPKIRQISEKRKRGKFKKCLICGKNYWAIPSHEKRRKFCSYKCYHTYQSQYYCGERHYKWKGGIRKENIIRHTAKYKKWRKWVFGRDLYTCQMCGRRGGELEVHHILPRRVFPQFYMKKENGITLCKTCHFSIKGKEWLYAPKFLGI